VEVLSTTELGAWASSGTVPTSTHLVVFSLPPTESPTLQQAAKRASSCSLMVAEAFGYAWDYAGSSAEEELRDLQGCLAGEYLGYLRRSEEDVQLTEAILQQPLGLIEADKAWAKVKASEKGFILVSVCCDFIGDSMPVWACIAFQRVKIPGKSWVPAPLFVPIMQASRKICIDHPHTVASSHDVTIIEQLYPK